MNIIKSIASIALGLLLTTGVYAGEPCEAYDLCVLESIEYIEEDSEFKLGFNTADYLPEDFDPYSFYFNLNSVAFLELDEIDTISTEYLPEGFDPFAAPSNFMDISYIDPNDLEDPVVEIRYTVPVEIDAVISK